MRATSGLRLTSSNLELVPCTRELSRASLKGADALARALGIEVPPTWPPKDLIDVLATYASSPSRDLEDGWGIWLLVGKGTGSLVGSAGFKGRPDRTGFVEVGYGIERNFRRRGYATEALICLVQWAWGQGVTRIVAECHEANVASLQVLRRTGMTLSERRGKMLWWELRAPS